MKGKKSPSRESNEPQKYLIRIESVNTSYMFGINPVRRRGQLHWECDQPYWEFYHPKIIGQLMIPDIPDVSETEITLIGDRSLNLDSLAQRGNHKNGWQPKAVGHIEVRNGKLDGVISVPFDTLSFLQPALVTKQIEFLELDGKKLKYREALVRSVHFAARYTTGDD